MSETTRFVVEILLFVAAGLALGLGALLFGRLVAPRKPGGMKEEIYECGEPTVGPAWVQFDLRFYVVALLFVIFDVEIALLYPWAVAYQDQITLGTGVLAFVSMLVFLGLIVLGFGYLWRYGYLDWVRSVSDSRESRVAGREPENKPRMNADERR